MKEIKVAKLHPDAKLPTRKHPADAGIDLYCWNLGIDGEPLDVNLYFGDCYVFHTGITIEIPEGYVGLVWPKSRHDFLIGGGVIDSGYQGEILVKVINPVDEEIYIPHGEPIAQLLIQPIETPVVVEVPKEEIHKLKTSREGSGGIVSQLGGQDITYLTSKLEFVDGQE